MTNGIRRGLEGLIGIGAVAGAVIWLSGGCEQRVSPETVTLEGRPLEGLQVETVEARTEPAFEWSSGGVASARHTSVASRVLARIEEVRVRAGSDVELNDVVVRLDARDLAARRAEAEEGVRGAAARLELAQRGFARTEELFRGGVAPQQRLDEASAELRAAQAAIAGAKSALEEARTAASFAEIRSPVRGRVIDRLAEPGDTAVPGRPLLRIYDPTLLRVEAPVRESLAAGLMVGDSLRVDLASLGQQVDGRIDEIVPFAEPGARTLLVKVSLPRSEGRLFAGMYARIAIPAGTRERVLASASAIERIGQLEFAWVVGTDDEVERRLVTTGEADGRGRVEVLSGLAAGERVVVSAEGSAATVDRPAAAAAAVAALRERLGAALKGAMAEGGPAAAIEVCRVEAPKIAAATSGPQLRLGRTSHRLRNPANAPLAWVVPLLAEYRSMAPQPGSFRVVDLGSEGTGYVEPIYMAPLCSTCHGENVAPELLAQIRQHYPEDRAVGFRTGELRGLFWAVAREDTP